MRLIRLLIFMFFNVARRLQRRWRRDANGKSRALMLDHFWLGGPGVQQNNFRCYRCRSIHRGAGIGGRPAGQDDFMDLHGSLTDATIPSTASHKENRAAAVGGRIGFLIAAQVLTYVNGAWTSTLFSEVDFPGGAFSFPAHTFSGGFIGGGTEVAVAGMPRLYWAAGGRIGVLVTSQVLNLCERRLDLNAVQWRRLPPGADHLASTDF